MDGYALGFAQPSHGLSGLGDPVTVGLVILTVLSTAGTVAAAVISRKQAIEERRAAEIISRASLRERLAAEEREAAAAAAAAAAGGNGGGFELPRWLPIAAAAVGAAAILG